MSEMFWPLGVLAIALPIYGLILVAGAVVLVSRGHRTEALNFSLAVIMAAALLTAATGFARLLAPLFSDAFGRDFTYATAVGPFEPPPAPPGSIAPSPPAPSAPQQAAQEQQRLQAENAYRDDLVYGATMLVVGLLVVGVLQAGRWVLRRQQAEVPLFGEAFLLLLLITTTIVGLTALIAAVAELLRRYVVVPVGPGVQPPHPGAALATAIAFLPLWGWFLVRGIQAAATRAAASPAAPPAEPRG